MGQLLRKKMIPKVTENALREAISQVISKKVLNEMTQEEAQAHLDKYSAELQKRQPELVKYLLHNMAYLQKINKDYMKANLLPLHAAIVINSLYIQDEINEVERLFNLDENKKED